MLPQEILDSPKYPWIPRIFPGIPKSQGDIMYTPGLDCVHLILGEESHNTAAEEVSPPHPTICSHCVQVSRDTRDPPKLSPLPSYHL